MTRNRVRNMSGQASNSQGEAKMAKDSFGTWQQLAPVSKAISRGGATLKRFGGK
jgi:hypothetical protein